MIVIGLTGSIGMGKSTVAAMFEELGAAIWSADDAVHRLYAEGGAAVGPIGKEFPEAIIDDVVDRERLGALVLNNPELLRKLEAIVHPLVAEDRAIFLKKSKEAGCPAAVMDIPLLFETGQEKSFDTVVVVSAPAETQRHRVLARPGMSEEKLNAILNQQTPDAEKRMWADYIISTDRSLEDTQTEVGVVYDRILEAHNVKR